MILTFMAVPIVMCKHEHNELDLTNAFMCNLALEFV